MHQNSRGQIVGGAFNAIIGEVHAVLLTPCDEVNAHDSGCKDLKTVTARGDISERPRVVLPEKIRKMLRKRLGSRYHIPSLQSPSE
jgi:hypothetical protein